MAAAGIVTEGDIRVQVGSGRRAHVFRPHPDATFKRNTLRDGGVVFDIALCGARGRMVDANEDMETCASCAAHLD
jgi:hypothetical protein